MRTNEIICGDCLEILKSIDDRSIDCVVTSPPYNLGGDFHTFARGKRVSYGGYDTYNDKLDEKDYQENQIEVLEELYRVTKDQAYCFYVHKERIKNNEIISPIEWLKKTRWKISQTVVLDMGATANVDKRRFFPVHEFIYVLCKGKDSRLQNEQCLTSIWKVKKIPRKISGHPATFDYEIPFRCIQAATKEGDIVLDPYMGTGTTALAALLTGRKYMGIEISPEYTKRAQEELEKL